MGGNEAGAKIKCGDGAIPQRTLYPLLTYKFVTGVVLEINIVEGVVPGQSAQVKREAGRRVGSKSM